MIKRIRPYLQVALLAQVFIFVGCGGSNTSPIAGTAGTGSGAAGTTGAAGGPAGTNGGAGTTGAAGAGGSMAFGEPACLSTVVKGGVCGPADQQFCYKTCGPERTGVKTETCQTSGTYAEMSGCTFDPSKDYSCYKIPTEVQTACPAGVTPQGSMPCDTPHCTQCNSLQGVTGGQYLDSTGAPKVGWCTCQVPNSAGLRTWTCATDTAWPCPLGAGC